MPRTPDEQKRLISLSAKLKISQSHKVSLQTLLPHIEALDVIFFYNSSFMTEMVSLLERYELGVGAFTHVALVVSAEILPYYEKDGQEVRLEPDTLYLFESVINNSSTPDLVSGEIYNGVQLRKLTEVIFEEGSQVAWCKLKNNPLEKRDDDYFFSSLLRKHEMTSHFTTLFKEYHGTKYAGDTTSLLCDFFPCLRDLRNDRDIIYEILSFFNIDKLKDTPAGWQSSAELIMNIYVKLGIVPDNFDPRDTLPVDFLGCGEDWLPPIVEKPVYIC